MIDQKVLEKLARLNDATILRRLPDSERTFFEYGFQRGYYRALKDLWHPNTEEPREFAEVLAETKITESIKTYISFKRNDALFEIGMLIVRVLILLVGCILMICSQRKEAVSND